MSDYAWSHSKYIYLADVISQHTYFGLKEDYALRSAYEIEPLFRDFYLTYAVVYEVNAGGWKGYFEAGSSSDLEATLESLTKLNLLESRALLEKAISCFSQGIDASRKVIVKKKCYKLKTYPEHLEELADPFYKSGESGGDIQLEHLIKTVVVKK